MDDDLLSQVLSWVRLRGERVYHTQLSPPWRLRFTAGASHILMVESGQVDLRPSGEPGFALEAGDVVLMPHGLGHELSNDPSRQALSRDAFAPACFDASRLLISNGTGKAATKLIGGQFRYDRHPLPPLLRQLPTVIRLKPGAEGPPEWRRAITFFLMQEVSQRAPGASLMLSRIIDLLVIRTLRSWADEQAPSATWLAGHRVARLSAAIKAMHDHPADDWSVAALAKISGMSRSVFAETFSSVIGEPPLRYLARWRLALAADLLTNTELKIADIVARVGYSSEPGFSRAFKSAYGRSPSHYRSEHPGAR